VPVIPRDQIQHARAICLKAGLSVGPQAQASPVAFPFRDVGVHPKLAGKKKGPDFSGPSSIC